MGRRREAGVRATFVRDTYLQCLSAKREFLAALERCAIKGWPDLKAAVRKASRLQELFCDEETLRLNHLHVSDRADSVWRSTTIGAVHRRLRDDWKPGDEEALRASDAAYAVLRQEIEDLQSELDSEALTGPFEMVQRDDEYIAARQAMAQTLRGLDRDLAR